jgi:hypothetical protein
LPLAWAEAGAAPWHNIVGNDPGLVDPEHGDFRPLLAGGYGCRVLAARAPDGADPPLSVEALPVAAERLEVGGEIGVDTVWDASEIVVTDDVTVVAGASLAIAAGATVRFAGFHRLVVDDGDLQAVGTPQAPITFTSSEPEAWRPDLERTGAWNGIVLANVPAARDSTRLRWCVLERAKALPGDEPTVAPTGGGVLVDGVGGALRVAGRSPLVVSHCVLRHNLAERGGAIGLHHGARPLIVNNLLHDNHATLRASAIWISYADAVLVHNTLTANDVIAPSAAIETGCIDHVYARPWHVGNIVWANTTTYYEPLQIREPKAINTRFCDIEGWTGGEGCLQVDPLFTAGVPAASSPVVDAGNAAVAEAWLPALDLAGAARLAGTAPDMGAYEVETVAAGPSPTTRGDHLVCWPNPFNPATTIGFALPHPGRVRLAVHDPRGRCVATLIDRDLPAGTHRIRWQPRAARSGAYLVVLDSVLGREVARITLLE